MSTSEKNKQMILVGKIESPMAVRIKSASERGSVVVALNRAVALDLDEFGTPYVPLVRLQGPSSWAALNRKLRVLGESFARECLSDAGSTYDPYVSSALHMWMPTLISSVNRQFALASALRDLLNAHGPQSVKVLITERQEEEEYAALLDLLVYQQVPFSRSL